MFHQPILFPTQGPSGDTNSYLCSTWPSQGGLGGGSRWWLGHRMGGKCPPPIPGHTRGCLHVAKASLTSWRFPGLCPGCKAGPGPQTCSMHCVWKGAQGYVCSRGQHWQGWGISICCPAPGMHPIARAEQVGCWLHMLALTTRAGPVGLRSIHRERASLCLPRGRQGGMSGQGGLSRQAPGAAIGFCLAMLSLSIQ